MINAAKNTSNIQKTNKRVQVNSESDKYERKDYKNREHHYGVQEFRGKDNDGHYPHKHYDDREFKLEKGTHYQKGNLDK